MGTRKFCDRCGKDGDVSKYHILKNLSKQAREISANDNGREFCKSCGEDIETHFNKGFKKDERFAYLNHA